MEATSKILTATSGLLLAQCRCAGRWADRACPWHQGGRPVVPPECVRAGHEMASAGRPRPAGRRDQPRARPRRRGRPAPLPAA